MFFWNITRNKDRDYYICCDMIHKYFFNSIFYSPLIKGVSIDFFFSSMVLGLDAYLEEKLKKSIFIYYLFIFGKSFLNYFIIILKKIVNKKLFLYNIILALRIFLILFYIQIIFKVKNLY